ncbi:endonuclease V [Streptomyces sp. NBC_01803]|uniref:endonuclease V n=1 Tax=Streptomyces sp. NBC_01803 TaxID=2975946 RepID=UPI003FA3B3B7
MQSRSVWPRTVNVPATEEEAFVVQEEVRAAADPVGVGPGVGEVGTVVGVDVTYEEGTDRHVAAAVVLDAGSLEVVEEVTVAGRGAFPYVPGLLAFREVPSVLAALEKLRTAPDLIVCDGYGIAHPRRAGLAVHLGVVTGVPCFGVAKSPFAFEYQEPGPERGAMAPLTDDDGDVVGRAVRTRAGVKPVFVSVGSGIGLDNACAHTLRLTPRYRLPETTRRADHLSRQVLREAGAVRHNAAHGH